VVKGGGRGGTKRRREGKGKLDEAPAKFPIEISGYGTDD